jgi:hypothetical protein
MDFGSYLRERVWLASGAAVLGVAVHCSSAAPPPCTLQGLASLLGQSAGGVVSPDDIAWEESPGFWAETFVGRRLFFLSAPAPGLPRDLYRARVRVTFEGQPIAVRELRNITVTPAGDDGPLELNGHHAAFATVAYGRIQGVTVLDTQGIRDEDRPSAWLDRVLLMLSSYQQTASLGGMGRADIVLDVPVSTAQIILAPPRLAIDVADTARNLVYDIERRTLVGIEGSQAYGARAVPQHHGTKPMLLWAVDTVRALVGPDAVAWLENAVFGAKDAVKRRAYAWVTSSPESTLKSSFSVLDTSHLTDAENWPPSAIPSLWEQPKPGEGQWLPVDVPFLKPTPADHKLGPPAYFYQTIIRPDAKRPYSELLLIAMDMRQLELGMEAGYEDPKPSTGPPGTGRLPRDPATLGRVVATFNGAFKSEHGQYGMMVDRRVLVPPVRGAATIAVDDQGRTALGSWPELPGIPSALLSFRQNLDPLLEDGVINPTGRYVWGWQLAGTSVMTQRTALCVTPAGNLYYAFGEEIDAPTLGRGLRQAGCSYAVHLDMNPKHCGFVFTDIEDLRAERYHLKLADRRMEINADRFVRWSPKDFFYVMRRAPRPIETGGYVWEADGGMQPPPAFLAGIFRAELSLGGLKVELLSFDSGRLEWRVRAGTLEPTVVDAPPKELELSGEDQHRVLGAIGLGHTTSGSGYGLAFGAEASLPLRPSYATLVLRRNQAPELLIPGEPARLAPGDEAVQLPLLASGGEVERAGRATGALRQRGALCVTPQGRVLVARSKHDSSTPLAVALLRAGCERVAELDRGSQHPTFVHRAGTSTPPTGGYETSVLYALGQLRVPYASRWNRAAPPSALSGRSRGATGSPVRRAGE